MHRRVNSRYLQRCFALALLVRRSDNLRSKLLSRGRVMLMYRQRYRMIPAVLSREARLDAAVDVCV